MPTVRTVANRFHLSIAEVMEEFRRHKTRPFSADYELPKKVVDEVEGSIVEGFLKRKYIFFSLTAMEKPGAFNVIEKILNYMDKENTDTRIIAVSGALDQLKKDAQVDSSRPYLKKNAELFSRMLDNHYLDLINSGIAEEGVILGHYIRDKLKGTDSILILGNNMSLNTCIYLRNNRNINVKDYIWVQERSISAAGKLPKFSTADDAVFGPPPGDVETVNIKTNNKKERFEVVVEETKLSESPLPLHGELPSSGDTVYVNRNNTWVPLVLGEQIDSGGEAKIYSLDAADLCAKVYFPKIISERKMKKLALLCDKFSELRSRDNSVIHRISWPQEMIFSESKDPMGYIMEKFTGVEAFNKIPVYEFSDFMQNSKSRQIIASISFVELIRFLHENNIILCDINQGNILFDDSQRAYLVDLDSAQVTYPVPSRTEYAPAPYKITFTKYGKENTVEVVGKAYYECFPANVAVPQFLPPERIDATTYSFLHDKADDIWQVQYMLFLLLTMGGAFLPYANSADKEEGKRDIKEGNYLYWHTYSDAKKIQESNPYYYMHCTLSRMPEEIRDALYHSFHGKGKKFKASDRDDAKIWMKWLVKYYYELPNRIRHDPEDGVTIPESIKYVSAEKIKRVQKLKNNAKVNYTAQLNFLDEFDAFLAKH